MGRADKKLFSPSRLSAKSCPLTVPCCPSLWVCSSILARWGKVGRAASQEAILPVSLVVLCLGITESCASTWCSGSALIHTLTLEWILRNSYEILNSLRLSLKSL